MTTHSFQPGSDRWVLQAAPTGFSAVVHPDGHVEQRTGISEQKVLYDTIELVGDDDSLAGTRVVITADASDGSYRLTGAQEIPHCPITSVVTP